MADRTARSCAAAAKTGINPCDWRAELQAYRSVSWQQQLRLGGWNLDQTRQPQSAPSRHRAIERRRGAESLGREGNVCGLGAWHHPGLASERDWQVSAG